MRILFNIFIEKEVFRKSIFYIEVILRGIIFLNVFSEI